MFCRDAPSVTFIVIFGILDKAVCACIQANALMKGIFLFALPSTIAE